MFTLRVEARGNKRAKHWQAHYHGKGPLISLLIHAMLFLYIRRAAAPISWWNYAPHKTLHFYSFPETPRCQHFALSEVLALLLLKHHLWSCTHTRTHTRTLTITQRLWRGRCTTTAASTHTHTHTCAHKMSVGRGRWQWPCHNLSLIIYTARLTVSMQRPEKIQPTNLICTQRQ